MAKNTTHLQVLARALSKETGEPYQACLAKCRAASSAGLLAPRLNDEGMLLSLETLKAITGTNFVKPSFDFCVAHDSKGDAVNLSKKDLQGNVLFLGSPGSGAD